MGFQNVIFGKHNTLGYKAYVRSDFTINHSSADLSELTIPGRDGVLMTSNHRFKSFEQEFELIFLGTNKEIKANVERFARDILAEQYRMLDIMLTSDTGFIYRGYLSGEGVQIKNSVSETTSKVTFVMQPYKYMQEGLRTITLTSGRKLTNPGTMPSKPRLIINGSGTVRINNLTLKNIDRGLIIDSEMQTCTNLNETQNQFNKMYGKFIELPPGDNTITWDNNSFTVQIIPRWVVRT